MQRKEGSRQRSKKYRENRATRHARHSDVQIPQNNQNNNINQPTRHEHIVTHEINGENTENNNNISDRVTRDGVIEVKRSILTIGEDKIIINKEKKERMLGTRFDLVTLPEEWRAYCEENRKDLKPDAVFEDFRDYWIAKPGAAALKLDWAATWRTWVRKQSAPNTGGRMGFGGGPVKVETTEERYNRMKAKGLFT